MYPHERSLVIEMTDKPFALIGVNSDRTLERAHKAVKENGLNWRSFQNQPEGAESSISDAWYIRGWPTIVVLDAERKIHYRGHNGEEATKVAERLVAGMEKAGKR